MNLIKHNSKFFLFAMTLFVFSCNNNAPKEKVTTTDSLITDRAIDPKPMPANDSLTVFTNMEQIEYCLPLPLKEYTEDFDKSDVKAKHVFKHKTKKDNEITVQGMFREDPSVSIEGYFKNRFQNSEEQGEIVEKKVLFKNKNCFYAKGYMPNFIDKYKFIEVAWLRKDEVIVYSSTYDISDTTIWNERLELLINSTANCN